MFHNTLLGYTTEAVTLPFGLVALTSAALFVVKIFFGEAAMGTVAFIVSLPLLLVPFAFPVFCDSPWANVGSDILGGTAGAMAAMLAWVAARVSVEMNPLHRGVMILGFFGLVMNSMPIIGHSRY